MTLFLYDAATANGWLQAESVEILNVYIFCMSPMRKQ